MVYSIQPKLIQRPVREPCDTKYVYRHLAHRDLPLSCQPNEYAAHIILTGFQLVFRLEIMLILSFFISNLNLLSRTTQMFPLKYSRNVVFITAHYDYYFFVSSIATNQMKWQIIIYTIPYLAKLNNFRCYILFKVDSKNRFFFFFFTESHKTSIITHTQFNICAQKKVWKWMKKICKIKETENNRVICIRRALELVKSLLIQKRNKSQIRYNFNDRKIWIILIVRFPLFWNFTRRLLILANLESFRWGHIKLFMANKSVFSLLLISVKFCNCNFFNIEKNVQRKKKDQETLKTTSTKWI